jgi:hypothetical protein
VCISLPLFGSSGTSCLALYLHRYPQFGSARRRAFALAPSRASVSPFVEARLPDIALLSGFGCSFSVNLNLDVNVSLAPRCIYIRRGISAPG